MKRPQHYCPACSASLATDSIEAPLRCGHCGWHLITLAEWKKLPPYQQGYASYMQGSWPTSEIASQGNPYKRDTPNWIAFCQGEQRAVLNAQDGEE